MLRGRYPFNQTLACQARLVDLIRYVYKFSHTARGTCFSLYTYIAFHTAGMRLHLPEFQTILRSSPLQTILPLISPSCLIHQSQRQRAKRSPYRPRLLHRQTYYLPSPPCSHSHCELTGSQTYIQHRGEQVQFSRRFNSPII